MDRDRDVANGTGRALTSGFAEEDGGGSSGTGGKKGRGGKEQLRKLHETDTKSSEINRRSEGGKGVRLDKAEAVDAQKHDKDDEASTDGGNDSQSNCAECLKPFKVLEKIR